MLNAILTDMENMLFPAIMILGMLAVSFVVYWLNERSIKRSTLRFLDGDTLYTGEAWARNLTKRIVQRRIKRIVLAKEAT